MERLQGIKQNFNKGIMLIVDMEWLIQTVEQQQREFITLSESIVEDDEVIEAYRKQEAYLLERLKRADERIEAALKKAPYMDLDD